MTATYLGAFTGGSTFTADLSSFENYRKIKKSQIYFTNLTSNAWAKCHWDAERSTTTPELNILYESLTGTLTITGGYSQVVGYADNGNKVADVRATLYADVYLIQ